MKNYLLKSKLGVIISNEILSGNEKQDKIFELFEREQNLNMQYYMEYCEANGYVTPMDWIENHKHF